MFTKFQHNLIDLITSPQCTEPADCYLNINIFSLYKHITHPDSSVPVNRTSQTMPGIPPTPSLPPLLPPGHAL